ncbi:hypothetical protein EON66_04365 [archaeon]|nr:MAG: hypothetical protein EON66_04365 [archaeon]
MLASLRSMMEVNALHDAALHRVLNTPVRGSRHAPQTSSPRAAIRTVAALTGSDAATALGPQSHVGHRTDAAARERPVTGIILRATSPRSRASDGASPPQAVLKPPQAPVRTHAHAGDAPTSRQQHGVDAPLFPIVPWTAHSRGVAPKAARTTAAASQSAAHVARPLPSPAVLRAVNDVVAVPASTARNQPAETTTAKHRRQPAPSAATTSMPSPYSVGLQPLTKPTVRKGAVDVPPRPQTQPQRVLWGVHARGSVGHAERASTHSPASARCVEAASTSLSDRLLQLSLQLELTSPLAQPLSRKSKLQRYSSLRAASDRAQLTATAATVSLPAPGTPSPIAAPHAVPSPRWSVCSADFPITPDWVHSVATSGAVAAASEPAAEFTTNPHNEHQPLPQASSNLQDAPQPTADIEKEVQEGPGSNNSVAACNEAADTATTAASGPNASPSSAQMGARTEAQESSCSASPSPLRMHGQSPAPSSQPLVDEFDDLIPEDVSEDGGELSPLSVLSPAACRQVITPPSLLPQPAACSMPAQARQPSRGASFSDTFYSDDFAADASPV